MLGNKSKFKIIVVFIVFVTITALIPNVSTATISSTGYDFEQVEIGSSKSTTVSITNLGETDTLISGIVFANTRCSDFSITYIPDDKTIPAKGIMEIEINYTPTITGSCSDTLSIYNGTPFPSVVAFVGTGVESVSEKPELLSFQSQSLIQIREIQSFVKESLAENTLQGTGKGKSTPQNRVRSLNKMLAVAALMIENGNIQAAHNKLDAIYKKTDGNSSPEDFVTGKASVELANRIQDLIHGLNSI
jgi:hypothetical protein